MPIAISIGEDDVPRALEDRDFVRAIEGAFGTPIIETGFVY